MIDRVVLATKNPDKVRELLPLVAQHLPSLEIVGGFEWPEVEETGSTLEQNALLKAKAVFDATGVPALGDDTGLEVDALGGAPGVRTARFAGEGAGYAANRAALLRALQGVEDRSARFRTVVALVAADGVRTATGVVEGVITTEEKGGGGFGYDPVFAVGGVTLAEMGEDRKNEISHRARALQALAGVLSSE